MSAHKLELLNAHHPLLREEDEPGWLADIDWVRRQGRSAASCRRRCWRVGIAMPSTSLFSFRLRQLATDFTPFYFLAAVVQVVWLFI